MRRKATQSIAAEGREGEACRRAARAVERERWLGRASPDLVHGDPMETRRIVVRSREVGGNAMSWLDLVFGKPDLKNLTNPRKRPAMSREEAEGRLVPTATKRRAKEKKQENPTERESALSLGRGRQNLVEERKK
jgi:hypothetical protein